jgi:bifunctional DNA-binding transcriptional regulator/antitoxin component of YhaV-PrlF toxin-antitoxin module
VAKAAGATAKRMSKRVRAKAKFVKDGDHSRARVPSDVRDRLGAGLGDTLIFEEGCMESVQRAALLPGAYFVVRLERRQVAEEQQPLNARQGTAERAQTASPAQLESFADAVRRKQQGA